MPPLTLHPTIKPACSAPPPRPTLRSLPPSKATVAIPRPDADPTIEPMMAPTTGQLQLWSSARSDVDSSGRKVADEGCIEAQDASIRRLLAISRVNTQGRR